MRHTKGPWKANLSPRLNVKGPDKKSICAIVMAAGKNTRPYDEACSNANLIAAAPELLEALKLAQYAILEIIGTKLQTDITIAAHYKTLDAIAKAEGKL